MALSLMTKENWVSAMNSNRDNKKNDEKRDNPDGRSAIHTVIDKDNTTPSMRTIAMPADTNPAGDIFGGWILAQMDLAGGSHAFYVAQGRCSTVAVTGMQFHLPVFVGDEVSCYCATQEIGRTSVTVFVETWVRRRRLEKAVKVTEGLFTFVALDDQGKPRPVRDLDGELNRT